ncbi:MAG: hypothetical protein WCK73_10180, partial [Deltaproteobacteria bacterium]
AEGGARRADPDRIECFNEAAPVKTRKEVDKDKVSRAHAVLQRGRAGEDAEGDHLKRRAGT